MITNTSRISSRLLGPAVVVALAAASLSACGGGDGDEKEPESAPSESASPSPTPSEPTASETSYLPVPEGIELTDQGSELAVGDVAYVAYRPRQDEVGVLAIRVDRVEQTSFKESFEGWKLDAATKATTPYFVKVAILNAGETDLGGGDIPLYLLDSNNTLVQASSFLTTFEPCPNNPVFAKKFANGDGQEMCLVYLAPQGTALTAVSFRPTQEFDPITWTGEIKKVQPAQPEKGKGTEKKGQQGDN